MKYNPAIFKAVCASNDIHSPVQEFKFHPVRKWRFDFAWPQHRVALEVQGGIWIGGGHNRGAYLVKEHEKRNAAAAMGWLILYVQPKELCMAETLEVIRSALTHNRPNERTETSMAGAQPPNVPTVTAFGRPAKRPAKRSRIIENSTPVFQQVIQGGKE